MKISEISGYLSESPQMVDTTDFNMEDMEYNIDFTKDQMSKIKETLIETDDYILFRTGDNSNGYYIFVDKPSKNVPEPSIDYLVKYHSRPYKTIGKAVTQVGVWRRDIGTAIPNLTSKMFWEVLLPKFGSIMSDKQQTPDGKRFWLTRLNEAIHKGFRVGLYNENTKIIDWFNETPKDFKKWISSLDAWGNDRSYYTKRFIITSDSE